MPTVDKPANDIQSLDTAAVGNMICLSVHLDGDDAVRLKRLGICAGRDLQVIAVGDPMIVRVCGTQVGLSRKLATSVTVQLR